MQRSILITSFSLCLFLATNTVLASTGNMTKITYYETDGTLQSLSFWERATPRGTQVKPNDNIGYFNNSQSNQDIDILRYDNEKSYSLINLDSNQVINRINNKTYQNLSQAKNIKFYEFGKGIVESAIFMSNKGICQDFDSTDGINVDFVTNYYSNVYQNPNEFTTTFANIQIYKNSPSRLISEKIEAHSNNPATEQQLKRTVIAEKSQLLQADAGKLRSFIQYLCIGQLKQ